MSTAVALHWNSSSLHYVVAKGGRLDTFGSVELQPGSNAASIGKQLAEELSQQVSGRVKTLVALDRNSLEWQHLSLPPCPADELSDLVRMQSDREVGASSEEDLGFDYLPLSGDEQTPYQVLTVAIDRPQLDKIRQTCREANLTLDRLVPLAAGWPALALQASLSTDNNSQVFVAPHDSEATLWATQADRVVLFRQFQFANTDDPAAKANAISSELRRTLLSLSQHAGFADPSVSVIGTQKPNLTDLANRLDEQLDPDVQAFDIREKNPGLADLTTTVRQVIPLAGLAFDESTDQSPHVDLLNPRRRPKAEANYRTYALAGIAASLLVITLGWTGYRNLKAPLEQAEADQAALDLLEESREELAAYEKDAAAVRSWLGESPNVLAHLQQLSKSIRPKTLEDEEFPLESDLILEKLNLDKRQLVLDALARNDRAVQPFENRLREARYSPERGKSSPSKQEGYSWQFQSIVEIDEASDAIATEAVNDKVANAKPTESKSEAKPEGEPQS